MAVSAATFTDLGGAASDLFAGFGAKAAANLKAQGIDIEAEGTQIQAQSLRLKAQGDIAEGQEYGLAALLARKNEDYTKASTAIQEQQLDRQLTQTIGGQRAATGGAGLASSGSALDLMRDSASQGALARNVLEQQGQITEVGYEEQAKSYDLMQSTANMTATGEQGIAGQEDKIAGQQFQLAEDTKKAGEQQAEGDFIGAAFKAAAAIATLAP